MTDKVDFIKIEDDEQLYAVINLNNMIPVPDSALITFGIKDEKDEKYIDLLKKSWVRNLM